MSNNNHALKLIKKGYSVTPIPPMKKAPTIQGWPKLKITEDNFEKYFAKDKQMNVGVINGELSGNIVDIDIDNPTALDLADTFLPETGLIFGRKSKPCSHWIYVCDKLPKTSKFQSSDGCIIEIRAEGTQTVWPSSVHPSKEIIDYQSDGEPSKVKKENLETACKIITVGTILLDNYPAEGMRNDFGLSFANIALRLFGGHVADAKKFVRVLCKLAADDEAESRANIVEYTANKINNGEPVQGIPSLAEFIGQDAAKDIAKYVANHSHHESDMIEELNKEYAFILMPPQAQIIKEIKKNDGSKDFIFLQQGAFKQALASRWLGNKKLTQEWLESPLRRSYDGIEFAPTNPSKNKYNLFQGFPIKAAKGECDLYLNHIRNIICGGNEEYYHYFLGWLANILQTPEEKPGTAIVIRGKQGTGKSVVFKHFGKLLGKHYKIADNERYISGNFNSHLHDCLLLHLEEAFFAGDKRLEASLKEMITGNKILMEYKGKEPLMASNFSRVAITTNATWVIPAGLEERRFFVLDALDHKMQNEFYFGEMAAELEDGGYEALMDYLMRYEVLSDELRTAPKTDGLLEQKLISLTHEEKWWFEILNRGQVREYSNGWEGECKTSDVFESYISYADTMRVNYRSVSTKIGQFLKNIVPQLQKHKGALSNSQTPNKSKRRPETYYVFPDLETCRKDFEKRVGQEITWD